MIKYIWFILLANYAIYLFILNYGYYLAFYKDGKLLLDMNFSAIYILPERKIYEGFIDKCPRFIEVHSQSGYKYLLVKCL